MASLVIYGDQFAGQVNNGLTPQNFKYRFLAEGDSWMDRSAMFETSLPQKLAAEMDTSYDDTLIVNIAHFGDTMRRIGECAQDDFRQWLETDFAWKFDAILLSAGGNDFIDAARDPGPGLGILNDFTGKPPPTTAAQCFVPNALDLLKTGYVNPNFDRLYNVIQSSRHKDVPCFLNYYDVPTARDAPAFSGGRSWLYVAYTKNGIPPYLWGDLTAQIFAELGSTIDCWQTGRSNLHAVPTRGVLKPAEADLAGDSGDWLNEIHPDSTGWTKLAKVWKSSLKAAGVVT